VSLGHYYRDGISDTDVRADLGRARRMYSYAASYFGDPDAQYHLGRLLLDSSGPLRDPRQAARWLHAAANKGQYQAQAVLGRMLFKGENAPRQAARGLMWLALANSNAGPADAWIGELYESAFKQATADERAIAGDMLVRWMIGCLPIRSPDCSRTARGHRAGSGRPGNDGRRRSGAPEGRPRAR
jgi:hypothetical protein